LGADRVIDYTAQDFTSDTQRYDVVLDAVGKSSFLRSRRLLKPRGVYLSSEFGPLAQNLVLALVTPLFGARKAMLNVARDDPGMATYFREVLKSGRSGRWSTGGTGWTRSSRRTGTLRRVARSATW
jgi:NADPH:quinone reductase-like Zn-dependent oxidoreductase